MLINKYLGGNNFNKAVTVANKIINQRKIPVINYAIEHSGSGMDTFNEYKQLNYIINNDYRIALTDFFITCAVRWHRHYIKQKQKGFFDNDLPTIRDIKAINQIDQQTTKFGFETFPYHAMMFNLAYITEIHENLEDLIGLLIDEVKADFEKTKKDKWVSPSLFTNQYQKQLDKTYTFEKPTQTLVL